MHERAVCAALASGVAVDLRRKSVASALRLFPSREGSFILTPFSSTATV